MDMFDYCKFGDLFYVNGHCFVMAHSFLLFFCKKWIFALFQLVLYNIYFLYIMLNTYLQVFYCKFSVTYASCILKHSSCLCFADVRIVLYLSKTIFVDSMLFLLFVHNICFRFCVLGNALMINSLASKH